MDRPNPVAVHREPDLSFVPCGFRELGIYEKHSKLDRACLDVVIVEKLRSVNLT